MTDFLTFMLDNSENVFRYWVKKTIFTPLEQEKKYIDQGEYVNTECYYAYITDAIELPDGDILLELQDSECEKSHSYYKLSEIHMNRWEYDSDE